MTIDIVVPQIGEAVSELTLVSWLKQVGDAIKPGDVLFEVDSDKAIVEVEAFVEGTLVEILAPPGSAVLPNTVVARVRPAGEEQADSPSEPEANGLRDAAPEPASVSPVAQRMARELNVDLSRIAGSGPGGRVTADDVRRFAGQPSAGPVEIALESSRVVASPKARWLARERGVDLRSLSGTGIDGMIVARDVEQAAARTLAATPAAEGPTAELSRLRQIIAARTAESKQTVPHFYLMADVDMSQVNHLRDYCRALGWERVPTYTDVIVRACALALRDLPALNRHYSDGRAVAHDAINIGVAVATDDGLLVPVLNRADTLGLRETSAGIAGLAQRARDGKLKPGDMGAKSMVVSNLGMFGVDAFVAIIDIPDPMILAVGRVAERVVPVNGAVAIRPMCTLTLSVDHRLFDGVQGARFLERVKLRLENPFEILGA